MGVQLGPPTQMLFSQVQSPEQLPQSMVVPQPLPMAPQYWPPRCRHVTGVQVDAPSPASIEIFTAGLPPELLPDWPLPAGPGEAPPGSAPFGAALGFDAEQPAAVPTAKAHNTQVAAHLRHRFPVSMANTFLRSLATARTCRERPCEMKLAKPSRDPSSGDSEPQV
jgi:hypothetical protein